MPPSPRPALIDRLAGALAGRVDRRGFLARSAVVGSALAVAPSAYLLRPKSAYAAVCSCSGYSCSCGSLCCDGYTEFCCTIYGTNTCPPGTVAAGWWKADGSRFCGGPRYYLDCNSGCGGCGCGSNGVCSGACSGTPCGCANGSCDNRKAGCTHFRYGQCNQAIPCLGPIVCRIITCVPPWEIEPSCTQSVAVDERTALHDRPCLHAAVGNVDSVTRSGATTARVVGWALDPDVTSPIDVHIYVDGRWSRSVRADRPRPDVAGAFAGHGPDHGFDTEVGVGGGSSQICVYAINAGPGSTNPLVGCRSVPASNPYGSLESAMSAAGSGIQVRGWARDPDTTGSVQVHAYVDGAWGGAFEADAARDDQHDGHGFDVQVPSPGGLHEVCIYGINEGPGDSNPLLGCAVVDVGTPIGSVDGVAQGPGTATISGWAWDPNSASPVDIHVYVDDKWGTAARADRPRPDVAAAYPNAGPNRGFEVTVPVTAGTRRICAYAINVGPGSTNPLVGCRTITVGGNPIGSVDSTSGLPGAIRITGWALDPDSADPVNVHLYVDGRWAGQVTANRPRPDVAAAYPGYGTNHGFEATVGAAAGSRSICAYAINVGAGSTNPLIACRSVTVS